MNESNSKVLSQNEFEKARLGIMSNVLKNISNEKDIIEFDEILGEKLSNEIAPKYASRNGGYTRIVKIGQRRGDGALEVLLELV